MRGGEGNFSPPNRSCMRDRREIEREYKAAELHIREILLDIRDLLVKEVKKSRKRKKKDV